MDSSFYQLENMYLHSNAPLTLSLSTDLYMVWYGYDKLFYHFVEASDIVLGNHARNSQIFLGDNHTSIRLIK